MERFVREMHKHHREEDAKILFLLAVET